MLKWTLNYVKTFKRHKSSCPTIYSSEEIETVLRSEMRGIGKEITSKLIAKNNFLLRIKPEQLKKSLQRLKQLNFENGDIRTHPRILVQTEYQLLNNFQRLREVGFQQITAYRLTNCQNFMAKSVHFNQSFNFLPKEINVIENTFNVANVPITLSDIEKTYESEMQLEAIHRLALKLYFLNRMKFTHQEIDNLWYIYPVLKSRSLQSTHELVQLLEKVYNTPVNQLPKHILKKQPEEIENLLNLETVSGVNVQNIMRLSPMCNVRRVNECEAICMSYKIPEYVIAYSPKLLLMDTDILKERLNKLSKLSQEFMQHVAVGKLILVMGHIKSYILSQNMDFDAVFNKTFVNFYLNGFISTGNTNPTYFYLSKIFHKNEQEIKDALRRHPHSKVLSFSILHKNVQYLLKEGFTHDDIFKDLHIILYPTNELKEFFGQLKDPAKMQKLKINPSELSKSQILRVCVYLIEKKTNFTGDGVFMNSNSEEISDEDSWKMEDIIRKSKRYCK